MDKFFSAILPHLLAKWHDRRLGWVLPTAACLLVLGLKTGWGDNPITLAGVVLSLTAAGGVYAAWAQTNRVPKNVPGRTGIVLAISADDDQQDRQFRTDFIHSLRQRLSSDPEASLFHLVVFPRWLAEQCQDQADASRLLSKSQGHFMLWGRVSRRQVEGKPSHFLGLTGLVRHSRVDQAIQTDFNADFSRVAPTRVFFPEDNSVFHFDTTSEWTALTVRYIVGIAAMLSGDLLYAERLFLSVRELLLKGSPRIAQIQEIARRLPERLLTLYEGWHAAVIKAYYLKRDPAYLVEMQRLAEALVSLEARNYSARLSLAMCAFLLRRDVPEALRHLRECRHVKDATWRFSRAFLYAYAGDMRKAKQEYREAFQASLGDISVPVQCEEFIALVLAKEPDKAQLHYCSGLINSEAKGDPQGARTEFTRFIEHPLAQQFPDEVAAAKKKLASLQGSIAG